MQRAVECVGMFELVAEVSSILAGSSRPVSRDRPGGSKHGDNLTARHAAVAERGAFAFMWRHPQRGELRVGGFLENVVVRCGAGCETAALSAHGASAFSSFLSWHSEQYQEYMALE